MTHEIKVLPTKDQVEHFKMLDQLLSSIYVQLRKFSRKKPDEPLNSFKVKTINRILEKVKVILKGEPTIEFLDMLDDANLPTTSDSILVIAQYEASMERFRRKYTNESGYWMTIERPKGEIY